MYKLLEMSRKNSLLCCYFGYNFRIQRFDPGNENCRRNRGGNMVLENTKRIIEKVFAII